MRTLRMGRACGTALLILAGLALVPDLGRAAQMQRMLIGAGCYRIAAHATGAVAAYCLDQTGMVPRRGTILGETPALGDATVSVGDKTMALKTALARHLLRVEGTDAPDQLALVNTTDQPLSFCVGRPVVVMGNGMAYSADLKGVYDQIADLMRLDRPGPPAPRPTDEPDRHERLQQRLWSLVNAADARELASPPSPSRSDGEDCTVRENATVLCR
jgi:hypothetical protein